MKAELASKFSTSCDEKSCDHQHTVVILRGAMLQLALSNLREAQA